MDSSTPPPPLPSSQPQMTPQFCFNTTALQGLSPHTFPVLSSNTPPNTQLLDFLRLSRSTVDDSLSLHLNSLLTPSRAPFLPTTTSTRSLSPSTSRRQIPAPLCHDFKSGILFPSWQARQDMLTYCASVADSPDNPPEPPPQTVTHVMHMPSDKMGATVPKPRGASSDVDPYAKRRSRNYWGQEQVVDERTDPYSARDYSYTREDRAQVLRDLLANEEGVERIVRGRTWGILGERCLDGQGFAAGVKGHEEEWRAWREGRRR